jgi:ferredoxin-NADP reductase
MRVMPDMLKVAPLRWQPATIANVVRRTSTVTSVFLSPSEPFGFQAGQHLDLKLIAPDGYEARRAYSIASAPEHAPEIELAIEHLRDGEVSSFFHDVAEIGDEIEIRAPLGGHFVWSIAKGGPLLLVGAGSGVAPLMSMLRHRAAAKSNIPALLVVAARTWNDVIFRDELLAMEERGDGFALAVALTREAPARMQDFARRVDPGIMADVLGRLPGRPRHVYVCGSNAFVEVATQGLVDNGVAAEVIRTERYGA